MKGLSPKKAFQMLQAKEWFKRVIGSDWHLAQAIREELRYRDAWPAHRRDLGSQAEYHEHPWYYEGCVVLITERDTLYGRAIPHLYLGLFSNDSEAKKHIPLATYAYLPET